MSESLSNQIITKELAKKLIDVKGEVKGLLLKNDGNYVLKKGGDKGLKKLEQELKRLGYPIKYKKIKNLGLYPVGLRAISLLAIKKTFGLDDGKIREVVSFHPKSPVGVRLFVKFYSVPKIVEKVQEFWGRLYTVGKLTFIEFDEKEKHGILELRNFDIHPIICRAMEGHAASLAKMVLRASKVTCREIKCTFKGHDSHQFEIRWK
jgi:hypothetical protein